MPKVILGICRRKHCSLEGKVVNSSKCVIHRGYYNKNVRSNRNLDLQ
ncbi:MAG: hypothetical protein AB3P11_06835 [Wolbachia pipientis]